MEKREGINRADLVGAMKNVLLSTDKKEFGSGEDSFVFNKKWIKGYDGNLSVSYPFETGLDMVVRADELFRILNGMRGESVFLTEEEDSIRIQSGTTTLKMIALEEDEIIKKSLSSLNLEKAQWENLPEDFMEGMKLCSYTMSKNPTMVFLQGMRFNKKEILSSDDLRVSLYSMEKGIKKEFSLPKDSVMKFLQLNIQPKQYSVGDSWAHFKTENGAIFSSRVLKEKFPDNRVRALLPEKDKNLGKEFFLPEGLEECIDRAGVFCTEEDDADIPYISLYAEGKGLVVHGSTPIGEVYDVVPCDEPPMKKDKILKIAPEFLKRILQITRKFHMTDNNIFFQTEKFKHLVAVYIG